MKEKATFSFSRALLLSISALLFSISFSPNVEANESLRILIIIDSSKSVGKEGIDNIRRLLSPATQNDSLAQQITIITYPNPSGIKVSTFRNSAELYFYLQSLYPIKGSADLRGVISSGRTWAAEYSTSERFAYWISDGAGLGRLGSNSETILEQMRIISSLENWTVIETGTSNSLAFLADKIRDYMEVDAGGVARPLSFPEEEILPQNGNKKEGNSEENLDRDNLIAGSIAALFAGLFFIFMQPFVQSINRRKFKERRSSLLAVEAQGLMVADSSPSVILRKIPPLLKGPIDQFGGRYKLSERRQLSVLFIFLAISFSTSIIMFQSMIITLPLSFLAPGLLIRILHNQAISTERKKFSNEFPGFLTLLSSGLKSGLSLEQNIDAYCQQNSGIVSQEFRRVLSEVKMGSSLEESLENLATKRDDDDLTWLVTAISIQKNVGGSLSSIIDTVLETIRARSEVRREIKALSAEGKLSAYVLIALPIFIFVFLVFTRRSYVEVLWKESLGRLIFVLFGILIAVGWIWMKKVVNIKV